MGALVDELKRLFSTLAYPKCISQITLLSVGIVDIIFCFLSRSMFFIIPDFRIVKPYVSIKGQQPEIVGIYRCYTFLEVMHLLNYLHQCLVTTKNPRITTNQELKNTAPQDSGVFLEDEPSD